MPIAMAGTGKALAPAAQGLAISINDKSADPRQQISVQHRMMFFSGRLMNPDRISPRSSIISHADYASMLA